MIKDRILLGAISGLLGNLAKVAIDEVSLRMRISQRSFRATAAGIWLPSKKEADSNYGQLLGGLLDCGTALIGGVGVVQLLTATGRDQIFTKGVVSGVTYGSVITATISGQKTNKVQPKDAKSNLSYMVSHAVYGLVTTAAAAYLGDASLFTEKSPVSNWVRMVASNTK